MDQGPPGQQARQSCYQVFTSNDWTAQRHLAQLFNGCREGRQLPRSIAGRQVWRLPGVLGFNSESSKLWKALKNSRVEYRIRSLAERARRRECSVHPGPGLVCAFGRKATSIKPQAPSVKLSNQPGQASSDKPLSHKHRGQASSHKQQAH